MDEATKKQLIDHLRQEMIRCEETLDELEEAGQLDIEGWEERLGDVEAAYLHLEQELNLTDLQVLREVVPDSHLEGVMLA